MWSLKNVILHAGGRALSKRQCFWKWLGLPRRPSAPSLVFPRVPGEVLLPARLLTRSQLECLAAAVRL